MDVFDLQAKISLDTSEFDKKLADAMDAVKMLADAMGNSADGTKEAAAAMDSAINYVAGYTKEAQNATSSSAKYADGVDGVTDSFNNYIEETGGAIFASDTIIGKFLSIVDKSGKLQGAIVNVATKIGEFAGRSEKLTAVADGVINKLASLSNYSNPLAQKIGELASKFTKTSDAATLSGEALQKAQKRIAELGQSTDGATKDLAEQEQILLEEAEAAKKASDGNDSLAKSTKKAGDASKSASGLHLNLAESLKTVADKALSAAASLMKITTAAVGVAGGAVAKLAKDSLAAYGNYEQLVGGVETLFGAQGLSLEEYAESVGKSTDKVKAKYESMLSAQSIVLANADKAYQTAGLSANQYMETVTSFSASLIQSLGGDTEQAATVADRAIIDMADNANKMGTAMDSIQNAYQGFAECLAA